MGAAKYDVVSLLLAEAFVIALAGGLVGAGLAYLFSEAVMGLLPAQVPALLLAQVKVSWTSLLFALGVSLGAGVLFGLVPAFRMARSNLVGSLKSGARTTDQGRERLRSALVVGEVAIALVLLVASGLMLRTLEQLRNVDKGFNPESILTAAVPISRERNTTRETWLGFYSELRGEADAIPGVRSAALTLLLPLEDRSWEMGLHPEGVPVTPETTQSVLYNIVSPEYFETLGVPILRGRGFTAADREGANLVAVIDETMAERFWHGTEALGRQITFESDTASNPVYRTIVGIARNVRHYELTEPSRIQVYVPFEQSAARWGMGLRIAVKTLVPPEQVAGPLRELVARLDPNTPVSRLRPLDELVTDAMGQSTSITRLLTAFGASALALAALGIFGVMSYAVTRRQREIGIRIALGAGAAEVIRWVATRALRLTALGIVIGLLASMALTRLLGGLLYEVQPVDPFVFAVVSAALAGVALLAAYLPARRATRVDPVVVLNEEG
jgi:putative ABC transport system permease protein